MIDHCVDLGPVGFLVKAVFSLMMIKLDSGGLDSSSLRMASINFFILCAITALCNIGYPKIDPSRSVLRVFELVF